MWAQVGGTFWLTRLSRDREAAVRVAALTLLAHLASNKAPATRRMLLQGWPEAGTTVLKVCLLSGWVLSKPTWLGNVACACCWAACACVPYLKCVAMQSRLGCIAQFKGRAAVSKGLKDHSVLGHAVTSYQHLPTVRHRVNSCLSAALRSAMSSMITDLSTDYRTIQSLDQYQLFILNCLKMRFSVLL